MIEAPSSASARGYFTQTLPAVYLEDDELITDLGLEPREPFVIRWLQGLEEVLDPVVALLDNLAWHFDPETCPEDIGRELLLWVGLDAAAELDPLARRRVLRRAMEIGRKRGTLAGLRLLLDLAFEGRGITVTHSGEAGWDRDPRARPAPAPAPRMTVSWSGALTPTEQLVLRRLVEDACPAHVALDFGPGETGG